MKTNSISLALIASLAATSAFAQRPSRGGGPSRSEGRPSEPMRREPMSRPSAPVSQPSAPISRPSAPVERPSAPVSQPSSPSRSESSDRFSRGERPSRGNNDRFDRGERSGRSERPSWSNERPSSPISQPSAPISQPSAPISRSRERMSDPRSSAPSPVRDAGRRSNARARIDGWEPTNPHAPVDSRLNRRRENLENPSNIRSTPRDRMVLRNRTDVVRERVYRPPRSTVRDVRGNYVTHAQVGRVRHADERMRTVMRPDRRIASHLNGYSSIYQSRYRPNILNRYNSYNDLWRVRPERWSRWYNYGFYGGYYWNLGEYCEIQSYYWNPFVYYYYASDYSTNYWNDSSYLYQTWYGNDYASLPSYREPFPYSGVFYPTTSLRDLLLGASDMSINDQNAFHQSVRRMVDLLQLRLGSIFGSGFRLERNDIVITHYRLVDGQATVVEGTAGRDQDQYPFKAYLDLRSPARSEVFLATSEDPTANQNSLRDLDRLNDSIDRVINSDSANEEYIGIEYGVDPNDDSTDGRP
jgi:hypothetical protein